MYGQFAYNPSIMESGQQYYPVSNFNNEEPRLSSNIGQTYYRGTAEFERDLKGKNSTTFKKDDVIGRTMYTESGRPIVLRQGGPSTPQVKFKLDIPQKMEWAKADYTDILDSNASSAISRFESLNTNPYVQPENSRREIKPAAPSREHFQSGTANVTSESFQSDVLPDADELYKQLLRTYAVAVNYYLNNNDKYKKWKRNWEILNSNITKTNLKVDRLSDSDKDIAYTENKGEMIKFRWRDKDSYMSKNVFAYVLLHELTHQVFPSSFKGHASPFPEMLCVVCVAGFELQLFDLSKVPVKTIYTNGQIITNRDNLKREIREGISMLRAENKNSGAYYDQLLNFVNSF